jgi:F-type H+-transporting ATPase subunit c
MKRNLIRAVVGTCTILFVAAPAFAQGAGGTEASTSASGLGYIAAGIGYAIAAGLAALGQSRVAGSACEGIARNPGAGGRIQTAMILGLAFIETLVIFTLVVVLIKVPTPK